MKILKKTNQCHYIQDAKKMHNINNDLLHKLKDYFRHYTFGFHKTQIDFLNPNIFCNNERKEKQKN